MRNEKKRGNETIEKKKQKNLKLKEEEKKYRTITLYQKK